MSAEQLERMESALVRIESTVGRVQADVEVLKNDVGGLKADVGGLKADVARLDLGQAMLAREMRTLHGEALDRIADVAGKVDEVRVYAGELHNEALERIAAVDRNVDEVRVHAGALHEEALDRIAAIGDPLKGSHMATRQEVADLEERIGRRLDPLEMTVRDHSKAIGEIQRWRDGR